MAVAVVLAGAYTMQQRKGKTMAGARNWRNHNHKADASDTAQVASNQGPEKDAADDAS
jgi:hypothetical protein